MANLILTLVFSKIYQVDDDDDDDDDGRLDLCGRKSRRRSKKSRKSRRR